MLEEKDAKHSIHVPVQWSFVVGDDETEDSNLDLPHHLGQIPNHFPCYDALEIQTETGFVQSK